MNRREFLTKMLGVAAATVVCSRLDAIASGYTHPLYVPYRNPYEAVHREAWRLLSARLNRGDPYTVIPGRTMVFGQQREGVMFCHQLRVHASTYAGMRGVTEPAMAALANNALQQDIDVYGQLPTQLPGTTYAANVGLLRMIVQYDIATDAEHVAFDIVGGLTPEAQHRHRVKKQQALKARILNRRHMDPRLRLYA